jgi:hypothetical protein
MEYAPPFSIQRLNDPEQFRRVDMSGIGAGNDLESYNNETELLTDVTDNPNDNYNNIRSLSKISNTFFRQRLVEHFDILFCRNEIKWPSRLGDNNVNY